MFKESSTALEVFSDEERFVALVDSVYHWGVNRNITLEGGATPLTQVVKLKEEVKELEEGLIKGSREEVVDGIGDSLVVLLMICRLTGIDLVEALSKAYNEIADRKGKMINGVFVKESDLNKHLSK